MKFEKIRLLLNAILVGLSTTFFVNFKQCFAAQLFPCSSCTHYAIKVKSHVHDRVIRTMSCEEKKISFIRLVSKANPIFWSRDFLAKKSGYRFFSCPQEFAFAVCVWEKREILVTHTVFFFVWQRTRFVL